MGNRLLLHCKVDEAGLSCSVGLLAPPATATSLFSSSAAPLLSASVLLALGPWLLAGREMGKNPKPKKCSLEELQAFKVNFQSLIFMA